MNDFKIELGVSVESSISGFKGVVTSRSEHLNGCNRYWVSPQINKNGELPEGYWFDEDELDVLKSKKIKRGNNNRGGFPSCVK